MHRGSTLTCITSKPHHDNNDDHNYNNNNNDHNTIPFEVHAVQVLFSRQACFEQLELAYQCSQPQDHAQQHHSKLSLAGLGDTSLSVQSVQMQAQTACMLVIPCACYLVPVHAGQPLCI